MHVKQVLPFILFSYYETYSDLKFFDMLQNEIQDLKQIVPVHNSHVIALTQVCPNNLNGGLLT